MKTQTIIVAGGTGRRMKSKLAKQFLPLNGRPILMHTIEQFLFLKSEIYLVLSESEIPTWKQLVEKHDFKTPVHIVRGGVERFFSVKNALSECSDEGVILIHDGVRPLVSEQTIKNVIDKSMKENSAIPCINIEESVRQLSGHRSLHVDRTRYKIVQTPQGFNNQLIKESYEQKYNKKFTDDASVFEAAGYSVNLVYGNKENIKITTPEDLELANFLKKR